MPLSANSGLQFSQKQSFLVFAAVFGQKFNIQKANLEIFFFKSDRVLSRINKCQLDTIMLTLKHQIKLDSTLLQIKTPSAVLFEEDHWGTA